MKQSQRLVPTLNEVKGRELSSGERKKPWSGVRPCLNEQISSPLKGILSPLDGEGQGEVR
jgi:hypothetical protein